MSTTPPPPPGSVRCPRCDAILGPEQDWCLNCGAPARTRLAPRPNWKAPVVLVATLAVLSGIALAVAFVALTGDDDPEPQQATTTTATTPAGSTVAGQPGALTVPTAPVTTPATTPVTTTTTPAATTPATTTTTPAGTATTPALSIPTPTITAPSP